MINSYTEKIDNIFKKYQLYSFIKPWNFKMSQNNLESGMPYTLSNVIIINEHHLENELEKYKKNNIINLPFLELLIHEKTHIIQRYNQKKFNDFYLKKYQFTYDKIELENLPLPLKEIYMTNPDSNFDIWIYKFKEKLFYPLLIKINHNYIDAAYDINSLEKMDINFIKNYYNINRRVSFYHPNEVFACQFSHNILINNLDNDTINFIKNL